MLSLQQEESASPMGVTERRMLFQFSFGAKRLPSWSPYYSCFAVPDY